MSESEVGAPSVRSPAVVPVRVRMTRANRVGLRDSSTDSASRYGTLSLLAFALAIAAAVSVVTRSHLLAGLFSCAFLLLGVASTPLVLFARSRTAVLDLIVAGAAIAFALPVAGGFLMVEMNVWIPAPLAAAVTAAVLAVHTRHLLSVAAQGLREGLARDIAALRHTVTPYTVLAVLGLAICVTSAALQYPLSPGRLGMISALSWVWYLGFALSALAVADLLHKFRHPGFEAPGAAIPCLILIALVSLTSAVAYPEPRFEWVGHHIGPTEYLLHVHRANVTSNLYQAFPGLFAGAAWLINVGQIADPLTLARWFPTAADIATALGVALIARRLCASSAVTWTTAVLFGLSLVFGQDYFSPQAIGLVWAMAIFGLAIGRTSIPRHFEVGLILLLGICIAVTHQLTPFPVFAALLVLTMYKLVRPWWVSLTVLVPALAWEAAHYSAWHQYLNSGFFDITANTAMSKFAGESYGQAPIVHAASYTLGAGLLLVGLFAVLEVIRCRDQLHRVILLCAISPLPLLAATNYGGEADNRIVFFAMPWVATLAANWWQTSRIRDWTVGVIPLVLSATSYFAVTAEDWAFVESPASVRAERYAEHHAGPRTAILVAGDTDAVPVSITRDYPSLNIMDLSQIEKIAVVQRQEGSASQVRKLPALIMRRTGDRKAEVIVTQSLARFDAEKGIQTLAEYEAFVGAMNRSPRWKVVFNSGGAIVWRLKIHG